MKTEVFNPEDAVGIRPGAKLYDPQGDVEAMMKLYGQEVKEYPELPDQETLQLRARLVLEEALEFVEACGCEVIVKSPFDSKDYTTIGRQFVSCKTAEDITPNFKEYADGCADQLVVTYGALSAAGVKADSLFGEVNRSNMSKAWLHCSVCDIELTADQRHPGLSAEEIVHDGQWTVVRKIHKREDGKVLKAPTYSPADIDKVLDYQRAVAWLKYLCHEPFIKDALDHGLNMHNEIAAAVLPVDKATFFAALSDQTHPEHGEAVRKRQHVKTITCLLPNWIDCCEVARQTGLSLEATEELVSRYFDRFPTLEPPIPEYIVNAAAEAGVDLQQPSL